MSWLQVLKLAFALLSQALEAFAAGEKKEAVATVALPPEHVATLETLAQAPKS